MNKAKAAAPRQIAKGAAAKLFSGHPVMGPGLAAAPLMPHLL
jgi:hypothetical protein